MNGFTEHQTPEASETQARRDVIFTWEQAEQMLPLVRHIIKDLLESQDRLFRFEIEKESLDQRRHSLDWPQRSRRYQLGEEISREHKRIRAISNELLDLGVVLVDLELGQTGFPTVVNNRRALFSWRPGDGGIENWHFAQTTQRRPVPESWKEGQKDARVKRKKSAK